MLSKQKSFFYGVNALVKEPFCRLMGITKAHIGIALRLYIAVALLEAGDKGVLPSAGHLYHLVNQCSFTTRNEPNVIYKYYGVEPVENVLKVVRVIGDLIHEDDL